MKIDKSDIRNSLYQYYNGIRYITKENAQLLIDTFGSNNNGYEISSDGKHFYSITKDKGGRCGDFICHIPTESELKIIQSELDKD